MDSPSFSSGDIQPTHDHVGGPGSNKKRKAAGNSGRGVASLTPEQLAKKRANDREAQRAIRERTKNTIESLERRIHELTSQQPYQELQAIIRQKDAVQAENEEIRRRLASVVTILQPLIGSSAQPSDNGRRTPYAVSQPDAVLELAHAAQQNLQMPMGQSSELLPADQYLHAGIPSRSVPPQTAGDANVYANALTPPDPDPSAEFPPWPLQHPRTALNHQRETLQRSHELSENGEKLNFSFLIDSSLQSKNSYGSSTTDRRQSPHDRAAYSSLPDASNPPPAWRMLPKNCPGTCQLDHILLAFLRKNQQTTAGAYGVAAGRDTTYQSPAYPSLSDLLNPASSSVSDATPYPSNHNAAQPSPNVPAEADLSTFMTNIIRTFPNISDLPEKVATTFIMFLFMRWQVYPTQDNYHRMPEWLTPRPSQLLSPHPAWMDHLPWPRMRDRIVHNYQAYPFDNWFIPFTSGLSVNWPYEELDCLIMPKDNGDPIINPVFERHIFRLENWSVGPEFLAAYPQLKDTVIVREKKHLHIGFPLGHGQVPPGMAHADGDVGLSMQQGPAHGQASHVQGQRTASTSDAG